VVDSVDAKGSIRRETEIERADPETVICDLISGHFNDPLRVVAFNTLEHWAEDVSEDIAAEIQARFDIDGNELPEHIRDFVESHWTAARQLNPA
jgi:hypothetical protein